MSDVSEDGRIYDIIYMGERSLKMFKRGSRLYIIDPQTLDR